jgi:lycopene beta-cyclase
LTPTYDFILVGGGLANGLVAYQLARQRPDISFLLLEQGDQLGGNHTWSFHSRDVSEEAMEGLRPLLSCSWAEHEVRFPEGSRRLRSGYHSVRSERFHAVLAPLLGERVRFATAVSEVKAYGVRLASGEWLGARQVLDGRGFASEPSGCGYQVFFGQDLRLRRPHGLRGPILMDATCEQRGGFRFFYVLPWSDSTLLVEDTLYTQSPGIDPAERRVEIQRYAERQGWQIAGLLREEVGCLPIPMSGPGPAEQGASASPGSPAPIGVRGGLFHATTGYSFPDAVRLADWVTRFAHADFPQLPARLRAYSRKHWARQSYYRFLNRMLFTGLPPEKRFQILQRFYRLPTGLVERFYAGQLNWGDRWLILAGRPPIPLGAALRCLFFPDSPKQTDGVAVRMPVVTEWSLEGNP